MHVVEELKRGVERRPQRLLVCGRGTRATRQQLETPMETVEDLARSEDADERRRQLDGKRKAIEPSADLGDRGSVAVVKQERGVNLTCADVEQHHGVHVAHVGSGTNDLGRNLQRRARVARLPCQTEHLPARCQDRDTGNRLDQPMREAARPFEDVLAVVQDDQSLPVSQMLDQNAHRITRRRLLKAHRGDHHPGDEVGTQCGCEIDEPDPVLES